MIILLLLIGLFGWLTWRNWNRAEDEDSSGLILKWVLTFAIIGMILLELVPSLRGGGRASGFALPVFAMAILALAKLWAGDVLGWLLTPLVSLWDGGGDQIERKPLLSTVHAKRIRGKYQEALQDAQVQLDQFPGDFEVQMLMADILVENLDDLEAGVALVETMLTQSHTPQHEAFALNSLADWHLKHRFNPEAARRAIQRIIERHPGGVLASKAAQRLTHLPTQEFLDSRKQPRLHTLTHVEDYIQPGGKRGQVGLARRRPPRNGSKSLRPGWPPIRWTARPASNWRSFMRTNSAN